MPRLVLCADDFGLSPGTSQTIAALAAEGRINAASCMAVLPGWAAHARWLRGIPGLGVGLHLVLSAEAPLTAMPRFAPDGRMPHCDRVARDALLGRLPLPEIAAEIEAQFARFVAVWGAPPDFVDGHQHCHVLPGIRHLVIAATRRRAPGAWLRDCHDRLGAVLARPFAGRAFASSLFSAGFARAVVAAGLTCNDSFGGHYDFRGDPIRLLPRYLARPGRFHLVMCHPGHADAPGDGIAEARRREAAALFRLPVPALAAAAGLSWG